MSLLKPFEESLAAKNMTLDDFARCLSALEGGKAIHGSADGDGGILWSHVEQAQGELREILALSGRDLRIDSAEKCAMAVVAGPPSELADGRPAPRPKAYAHPGVSSHTLVCGLLALNKAQRSAGQFASDGASYVAPSDVFQFLDAQFGLALLQSEPKQQALFEAFNDLGFVAKFPGGLPGHRVLSKEDRVAVLPALALVMDPKRLLALAEHIEAQAAVRAAAQAAFAPESTTQEACAPESAHGEPSAPSTTIDPAEAP